MTTINDLNKDMIYEIQKYLSAEELILFSRTCKYLRSVFKDNLNRLSLDLAPYKNKIKNDHLKYLRGVKDIILYGCNKITNVGLRQLNASRISNLENTSLCIRFRDNGGGFDFIPISKLNLKAYGSTRYYWSMINEHNYVRNAEKCSENYRNGKLRKMRHIQCKNCGHRGHIACICDCGDPNCKISSTITIYKTNHNYDKILKKFKDGVFKELQSYHAESIKHQYKSLFEDVDDDGNSDLSAVADCDSICYYSSKHKSIIFADPPCHVKCEADYEEELKKITKGEVKKIDITHMFSYGVSGGWVYDEHMIVIDIADLLLAIKS